MSQKPKTSPVAMTCGGVSVRFRLTEESPELRRADIRRAAANLRYLADQVTMWGQLYEGPVNPSERPDIAAIQQRADAATPAPWAWRGNVDNRDIRLAAPRRGGMIVMDFIRWGTQGARPRLREGVVMRNAEHLAVYEVCPEAECRSDPRVYRGDIIGLLHPDAEFIASARQDIADLLAYVAHLEQEASA